MVLAAHGYPGDVRSGDVIRGLDDLRRESPDALVFCAGVAQRGPDLVTSGGRVMTIVSQAETFDAAIADVYAAAAHVRFDGLQYRRDIGRKALI